MQAKLTVSVDKMIIDLAKKNLQTKETSLSRLIEDYFKVLISAKTKQVVHTPIVEDLAGIARIPKGTDEKSLISDYLLEKYK
jgi:hypothetical protein